MTERKAVPTVPGPLEGYATQFDDLWVKAAQRESFRAYLQDLLLPRDRNKTLTALAGPISWCALIGPFGATGFWYFAPSVSAGGPGLTVQREGVKDSSGGKMGRGALASWPVALRQVCGWLTPWTLLWRWWRAWSPAPPPRELQELLNWVEDGQPFNLYLLS